MAKEKVQNKVDNPMTKEKVQNKVDNPMAKEKVQNKVQAIQWPKKKYKIKYRQSNVQRKSTK
jgi:hypothetical protein